MDDSGSEDPWEGKEDGDKKAPSSVGDCSPGGSATEGAREPGSKADRPLEPASREEEAAAAAAGGEEGEASGMRKSM